MTASYRELADMYHRRKVISQGRVGKKKRRPAAFEMTGSWDGGKKRAGGCGGRTGRSGCATKGKKDAGVPTYIVGTPGKDGRDAESAPQKTGESPALEGE